MTTKSRRYFGTDGIRGAANQFPMNADVALKVGRAAGDYFKRRGAPIAVVGKDTRVSGYMIESALTAGLLSVGVQVVKLGVLPTPAVSMLTKSLRAGMGVMISASHNPYHDNGIKLFNADGGKLSDTCEEEIEALIDDNDSLTLPDATGVSKIRKQKDASGRYIEFIKQLFPEKQTLSGMKIALDCANGAAFRIGPTVLRELGAECIDIAASPNGVNINKGCGSTHPEALAEKTREAGAAIGIALDGDADRIIVCDENGKIYSGDNILAALAVYMKKRDLLPGSA